VPLPVSDVDLITYMTALPLDFDPGTQSKYSNVGYVLLGQIIEKVSGRRYEDFVTTEVLAPGGVTDALLSKGRRPYQEGESRCYMAGSGALLPPLELPMVKAAGGWCMSSVNVARLWTALDGSRGKPLLKKKTFELMLAPPPPPLRPGADGKYNGLGVLKVLVAPQGYTYMHDGLFNGMRTFMKRSQKGTNWVLLFNVTMEPDLTDERIAATAVQEVHLHIDRLADRADVDYFKDFP
jgi:CubicO group peptidase (beta-lactamase class C family)